MNAQKGKFVSGGRLLVPADIRRQLGFEEGESVIMEIKDNELHVRSYRESVRRLQELFSKYAPKEGEMLASDELIADRRREAENE